MTQYFRVTANKYAYSVMEELEILSKDGYRYVGHIQCDDNNIVLVLEQDPDKVDFIEATVDYPILVVPERMGIWNLNQQTPDTLTSVE